MDPLGVAEAVLAITVYPGGLFLALAVWGPARLAGASWRRMPTPRELGALVALDLAVAMAPLPASPATSLPPAGGPGPDLVVMAVLVAAAVALTAPRPWSARRLAAGAAIIAALSLAAIAAASLGLVAIAGQPGAEMEAVSAFAAAAVLAAAPEICGSPRRAPLTRPVVLVGVALLGLSLLVPAGLVGWAALAGAVAAGVAGAGYGCLVIFGDAWLQRVQTAISALCGALAAAAIVVVFVAGRV